MRGDLALHARLLLRPRGIVGLVGAVAGLTAVAAVYLPWYEVRASISMLGGSSARSVAGLAGWEAQPWIWLAAAIGFAAAVVGLAVAVDLGPARARGLLGGAAGGLTAIAIVSLLLAPPQERFMTDRDLQQLQSAAGSVPSDVDVGFAVGSSVGLWLTLSAAALLFASAVATPDG
ncbi:MAG: hypothetical protein ACRDUY_03045 [Nitriliruptorales bacterium]